ncbi:MAG: serine/threonine protein kinase [Planctomycetaceae bacterium]|nr:serine/threonine protein kinase [Planctomycetaceae bacterium]
MNLAVMQGDVEQKGDVQQKGGVEQADRVLDLLAEWDAQRQLGRAPSPEELCPDDPALWPELAARIGRRQRLAAVFEMPTLAEGEATPPATALPHVAGYEILEVIGHGGMGVVYKARQLGLNRLVALKMILAGVNASPHDLARFRAEAEAVAQLQHPSILQIFEIGEQNGCPFLALEYIAGGSLAEHLNGTPVAPRQAAELVLALSRAVHHAHEKGIIHRDLKPANVLLLPDGTPKIADFGLAKRAAANQAHTQTGTILGSPSYMSPEQAAGRTDQVGPATDVYALGVILYELLTGRPPFKGASMLETIDQVREHDPVPPRSLQPKTPRDLETICLKCLEKQPRRRYATAADLAHDLRAYLHDEPITAHSLTVLDQVARSISHHSFDVRFRGFANQMLAFSPVPLVVHLIAYFIFRDKPYYSLAMVLTTAAMVFTLLPLIIAFSSHTLRDLPAWQRRHFVTMRVGNLLGMALVLAVVLLAVPADSPYILIVYPLWAIVAAACFLAHATEAGMYYMVAAFLCVVAFITALTPTWAPLEVAFFMTANAMIQALYLRRLSKQQQASAQPLLGAAPTTVKTARAD